MTTNIKGSDSNSTAHQCSPCASLSLEPRSHFDPYCVCGWNLDLLHLHGDIRHLRKNPPRIQLHDEPGSVWCWCFSTAGEIGKKFPTRPWWANHLTRRSPSGDAARPGRRAGASAVARGHSSQGDTRWHGPRCGASGHLHEPISQTSESGSLIRRLRYFSHFTNAWLSENSGWNPSLHCFEMHTHKCPSPRRWQRPRFEWLHFLQAPSHLVPELN